MNQQSALLDSLRGGLSKRQFARHLGISHRGLNYIEAGRRPGRRIIERLLTAYPQHTEEILKVFLLEEENVT